MKSMENSNKFQVRQEIAAEVLELGEMLFDTAIEMGATRSAQEESSEAALIEEMRAAADEFFMAVRVLLGIGQE